MSAACSIPIGPRGFDDFRRVLSERMAHLYFETYIHLNPKRFIMPVGLVLTIDEENGGDVTARELFKRFNLLNSESQNIIDFYFLGWQWVDPFDRNAGIKFNLDSFDSCRTTLKNLGINKFGGNADLILVDAHFSTRGITLNFQQAIYVNLSSSVAEKEIPSVGEFLQTIIYVTEEVRKNGLAGHEERLVFSISDRLGIATARKSFLNFIFQKWGEVIGAKKLQAVAVRNIGPKVKLRDLSLRAIPQGKSSS